MFYIQDKERDLVACVSCGVTALYWQLGGHECEPSVYEQLKGAFVARLGRIHNTLEISAIAEKTARAFWREHSPAGVRQLGEWRDRVPEENARILMFEGIADTYIRENNILGGVRNV